MHFYPNFEMFSNVFFVLYYLVWGLLCVSLETKVSFERCDSFVDLFSVFKFSVFTEIRNFLKIFFLEIVSASF